MNDYDKAARFAIKLSPTGFLRWLMPDLDPSLVFQEWIDTRTLPFPGERDRTCDTVALLRRPGPHPELFAFVCEPQSRPDPIMIDRLLEYLSRFNREQRSLKRRVGVAAGMLNLTGRPQPTQIAMGLPGTDASLTFQVVTRSLSPEDASQTLSAISTGDIDRCILPLIPLMRGGGKRATIREWKRVALEEPDSRLRQTYAGLALVFAELAKRSTAWKAELRRWDVGESAIVNQWRLEGRVEGQKEGSLQTRRADLLALFELRFQRHPPEELTASVGAETDLERLGQWFRSLAAAPSAEEFLKNVDLRNRVSR